MIINLQIKKKKKNRGTATSLQSLPEAKTTLKKKKKSPNPEIS